MKEIQHDDPIFSDGEEPTPGLIYDQEIRLLGIQAAASLAAVRPDQAVEFTVMNSAQSTWDTDRIREAGAATALVLREHLGLNPTISIRLLNTRGGKLKFRASYSFRPILT
jgi:predicted pyridoxine 5'-phosphate oxidase superfamily flavin-nucleotide-binding protein